MPEIMSDIEIESKIQDENIISIPIEVESIITQVTQSSLQESIDEFNRNSRNSKRSFLSRLMCCTTTSFSSTTSPIPSISAHPSSQRLSSSGRSPNSILLGQSASNDYDALRFNRKKLLALDLDETLVHSSFQPVPRASFVINVEIETIIHKVYVIKRPGVDEFLEKMSKFFEIVVYTASLSKYADPLLDILDPTRTIISRRLFREHCVYYEGHYVKDLTSLGVDLSQAILVDNSPMSYIFHPDNAIDCTSFFDDPRDYELWQIGDFLENIQYCNDVRLYCKYWKEWCKKNPSTIPTSYTMATTESESTPSSSPK